MKKILATLLLCCLTPALSWAEPMTPNDCSPKVFFKKTESGTLKSYYLEEYVDATSSVDAIINGKEISFVVIDDELITRKLKGKEGQRFAFTYERVRRWLGDGCSTHEVLLDVKPVK